MGEDGMATWRLVLEDFGSAKTGMGQGTSDVVADGYYEDADEYVFFSDRPDGSREVVKRLPVRAVFGRPSRVHDPQ